MKLAMKKIAVIVALLEAQLQGVARPLGRRRQVGGPQLGLEERVGRALVHQQGQPLRRRGDQQGGVPGGPGPWIGAQVGPEGLLAPGAGAGMADRGEGGHRAIAARVPQGCHQGSMAPHGVAADAADLAQGQLRFQQGGQLLHHVGVHPVMAVPGGLGGIDVEAGPLAQIPAAIWVGGNTLSPGAGVRCDQGQAEFGGEPVGAALLHHVLVGAGEA